MKTKSQDKKGSGSKMWILFALLAAVFAALTTIFAKVGLQSVDSNLATAIRTAVVLVMAWIIVFVTGAQSGIGALNKSNIFFLILSGLATGLSWLFYFKAVQMGEVSKVAPLDKLSIVFVIIFAFVFLREPLQWKSLVGGGLIAAGTFFMIL